ncbi:MAG: FG-GAP repeat domain-containing protein, partial [Gemmataceae bacterium]
SRSVSVPGSYSIAAGDFNGDGRADLVITALDGVTTVLGNGDGTFGAEQTFTVGSRPVWVAVADFNGDGRADLAVADGEVGGVGVVLGNGDGTFQPALAVAAGGAANHLAAGDLNADGVPDLAVVSGSDRTVTVVTGNGDGTFGAPTAYPTLVGPGSVGVGDFNRDGRDDFAVPTFFGSTPRSQVTVWQQAAAGGFAIRSGYATDSRPVGIAVADFNRDGKLDLVTANNFADNVYVFHGTGTGTFGLPTVYTVGDRPTWLTAEDFNGDGLPDLAVVNSNSSTVTLLQTPAAVAATFRVRTVPVASAAGKAFQVIVTALDGAGRIMTGYTGVVSFASDDAAALLPAAYRFTAADRGVRRFTLTLRTVGTRTVTARAGAAAGSASIDITPAPAARFQVAAAPAVAGAPFNVTVSALDAFGNVAAGYLGAVRFTTTDLGAGVALPAAYTFTAGDAGVHTFTGVTLVTAGSPLLRAISGVMVGSAAVAVQPAEAARLVVSAPTTVTAGAPFAVKLTARDAFNNVATGFAGTVHFATGGDALLPADYSFVAGDGGVHTFTGVALRAAGAQALTASAAGLADGVQGGIVVRPGAAAGATVVSTADTFALTAVRPAVTVRVVDAFGNPVGAGVRATLALGTNPSGAALAGAVALTGVGGIAAFPLLTVSRPGQGYTLVARAGTGTSVESAPFTVYAATRFAVSAPAGPVRAGEAITVTVTALDALNRPDPTYRGTVRFGGVFPLPADYTFDAADAGQHTFTLTPERAGAQLLTVADALKPTVKGSAAVTVLPAALSRFLITGFPLTAVRNRAYTFAVTAVDVYGNAVTDYSGTVRFSVAGGTAVLPGATAFTALNKGRRAFTAALQTAGAGQSLTVADDAGITGTVGGISVG